MSRLFMGCVFLLPLAVACGSPGKKPVADAGTGGAMGTGGNASGGTEGGTGGIAATGGRANTGGATGTGGSGQDPNIAYMFIVHASNRLRDERIDYCLQKTFPTRQMPPMGPVLAASGNLAGIAYGEMSAPREAQTGMPQDLLVVRAGSTDCNDPLATGAGGGNPGLTTGIVLFLQLSGSGSFGFPLIGPAQAGKDAINFRNFIHDGAGAPTTAQFISDTGTAVDFKFGQDVTLVNAPASGRIVVTSAALTAPLERPYEAVPGARTSVMLFGHGSEPQNWRIAVCDHDAPERDGAVDCRDTVRRK